MPSITLKNVPPELHERLKKSAASNRRSLNNEILVCLERAFLPGPIDVAVTLERARKLRELSSTYIIDDEEFNQLKSEGRK